MSLRPPPLLVTRISHAYRKTAALDDVSFGIDEGQFTALLGPNGAGKTTLFGLVTRLLAVQRGSIRIRGREVTASAHALFPIGVVFQQTTLDLDLTVRQNLRYFAALRGMSAAQARTRMIEELERLDMAERIDERVRELNGGHRRRVEIARALLHKPDLLLLDEPSVGLDVASRRAIVAHVHELAEERRTGVLWATHLIDEIDPHDQLVVLASGRVVASGTAQEVVTATGQKTLDQAFAHLTGSIDPSAQAPAAAALDPWNA